jgi:hypothetical protein
MGVPHYSGPQALFPTGDSMAQELVVKLLAVTARENRKVTERQVTIDDGTRWKHRLQAQRALALAAQWYRTPVRPWRRQQGA